MENASVSLEFIDEAIKDKITVLVGDKHRYDESYSAEVYFEVASYIHNLPEIIEKVEVKIENASDVYEGESGSFEFDDHARKEIANTINSLIHSDVLSEGIIRADAMSVVATLKGGIQISAWNSEWGGMSIRLPQQTDRAIRARDHYEAYESAEGKE